jgi:hypothetical protein
MFHAHLPLQRNSNGLDLTRAKSEAKWGVVVGFVSLTHDSDKNDTIQSSFDALVHHINGG